ncbi:winged helix-turn-helix transcriptional regulator [Marinactinospora thermotolerans]|uniref:Transcriptional regulator, HxlR family n=1 Tax=Marinactinospora thermotolerans DSM 45154 TaxID=1122192 RepID=A0A1T4PLE8_9ACTN|nr:helix-turn-helix domain-containing protein [Marinactinospora thermotolerans]SJZ92086.1 transcriptional regulator, HxlR family [Marinactinospora thermotolerans DSM 45154]
MNAPITSSETGEERYAGDLEFDVFARACPSRTVLEHLTGRWGVLVMAGLHQGPARFNALRRRVDGVSEKMLAQTLQALERDGFVRRDVHAVMPPRVEYSLTGLGHVTAAKLIDLIDHLEASMPAVLTAQGEHDRRREG